MKEQTFSSNSENSTLYHNIITQLYTLVIRALFGLQTTQHTQHVDYQNGLLATPPGTVAYLNIVLWKCNL